MIWQAFQTLVPVDAAGSGVNAYSIIFGRQRRSWSIPRGGSGALTDALARFLEHNGSTVLCNRQVSRLVIEDGRCTGVETDDGERYLARHAVLSTVHVKQLVDMAPPEAWGEEFVYGVGHLRRGHLRDGVLPGHRRGSRVRDARRPARRGIRGNGRLARGGARARAGGARPAPVRPGRAVAARGRARRSSIPTARRPATIRSSC